MSLSTASSLGHPARPLDSLALARPQAQALLAVILRERSRRSTRDRECVARRSVDRRRSRKCKWGTMDKISPILCRAFHEGAFYPRAAQPCRPGTHPRGPPGAGVARCGDIHLRTRAAMSARGPAGGIFLGHLLSFGTCTILEIALRSKKQFHFFACLGLEPWGLDQADTSSWRMHVSSPRTASHMCSMIKCRGCSRRHAAASRLLPRERRCCIRTHTASSYSRKRLPTCWQH